MSITKRITSPLRSQAVQHDRDHADADHRFARFRVALIVPALTPEPQQPTERSLDHPTLRSIPHSFGRWLHPRTPPGRRTIPNWSTPHHATSANNALVPYRLSAQITRRRDSSCNGKIASRSVAAWGSGTPAPVTSTAINNPRLSTTKCRLRPEIFLPAS